MFKYQSYTTACLHDLKFLGVDLCLREILDLAGNAKKNGSQGKEIQEERQVRAIGKTLQGSWAWGCTLRMGGSSRPQMHTGPLCWIEWYPQIPVYLEPQNMTLLENGVFTNVIKTRSYWSRMDPNSMTSILIRKQR